MADTENLYGDNAIVGNKEDALAGRDVEIKTTNTQTVTMSQEGDEQQTTQTQEQNQEQTQEQTQEPEVNPEQQLEKDLQTQMQADKDVRADLTAKGVDFNAIAAEYENNGGLSPETFAKLEQAGYPKSAVDAYIAGMDATAARFEAQVYDYAGGKEEFHRMADFVRGMGDQYVNAFNKVIDTGDLTQIRIAIEGFRSQMESKFGTSNRTVMGNGRPTPAVQGFTSRDEMVKAMSDPRYLRDPAYTKEVQNKTIRSTFIR